jgi:hypothetical protein
VLSARPDAACGRRDAKRLKKAKAVSQLSDLQEVSVDTPGELHLRSKAVGLGTVAGPSLAWCIVMMDAT